MEVGKVFHPPLSPGRMYRILVRCQGGCTPGFGGHGLHADHGHLQLVGGRYSIWGTTWGVVRCTHRWRKQQQSHPAYEPKTKREVRRLMGLAGFYRQFVPKFVNLTSRLIDLTCNGAPDLV